MEEIEKIKKVVEAINNGILAKPRVNNTEYIKLQTKILREKGYGGISYTTQVGKVVSVLEDGTVKVYSPQGQLMEEYPKLLGGEEQ